MIPSRRAALAALGALAALAPPGTAAVVSVNGWSVSVDPVGGSWDVTPPGFPTAVLSGPGTCALSPGEPRTAVRIGTGAPSTKQSFGAFAIELTGTRTMRWRDVCGGAPSVSLLVGGGVALSWPVTGLANPAARASLRFVPRGPRDLQVELACNSPDAVAGEIQMALGPGEEVFGLGSQVTGMSLAGRTYPLWTQEQGIGKPDTGGYWPLNNVPEAAYAPLGIWHGSRGYTAIVGHDGYSELDLGDTWPERLALRSYPLLPSLVLVDGAGPRERIARLADYVGRAPAPPVWAFGPWNDAVGGPHRLHAVKGLLRSHGIPSSAIWSEDWAGGEQGPFGFRLSYAWEWDPATYPDLPSDIADLHARGFAFLAYFNSFVLQTTRMWQEGVAGGYLVEDAAGQPYTFTDPGFRVSGLADLTDPGALAWLAAYQQTAIGLGVDGWMADFAEWMPYDGRVDAGASCFLEHNRYPIRWQQANLDALGPAGGTFFARSGWASAAGGTPGRTPLMWGGDQNTDWGYDDGFPTVVPIAAHLGLSGVTVFGTDIAGYTALVSPPTTKELFLRWAAFGAFSPLMRTHHGSDQSANWSLERDAQTLALYRSMARVHAVLLPYFQALLAEAQAQGLPMLRHPWLVEPGHPGLWQTTDYEIFLGDDVLLAPVLTPGATTRTVRAPSPGFWPMFGDAPLAGGAPGPGQTFTHVLPAPLGGMPVLVRPGTVLPLLAEPVDSFYGATDPGVTDLDDVRDRFRLALYPDGAGALRPTAVGQGSVSGSGFTALPVDWTGALVGGQPVGPCGPAPVPPCAAPTFLLVAGTTIDVLAQGASLHLASLVAQEYRIGIGGQGFFPHTMPPPPIVPE